MGNRNTTEHVNEVMNAEISEKAEVPQPDKINDTLALNETTAYIKADAFVGNPYSLLGRVVEIRSPGGTCPTKFNDPSISLEFSPLPIPGIKVDESSKIKEPIKRSSIVVDHKLTTEVGFLAFLNAHLDAESFYSLIVFDQATGLVDVQHESWATGLRDWKKDHADLLNDPSVCYLYAIIGIVQKNTIGKKYFKFKAGGKGGAYGLNVNGELAMSTDEYSLDTVFGLSPALLKRPSGEERAALTSDSKADLELFATASGCAVDSSARS